MNGPVNEAVKRRARYSGFDGADDPFNVFKEIGGAGAPAPRRNSRKAA